MKRDQYAQVTKPGKYGTLYLYIVRYQDEGGDASGASVFEQRMWAYNLEHVEQKFYDSVDAEGWKILTVERARGDLLRHRATRHAFENPIDASMRTGLVVVGAATVIYLLYVGLSSTV